MAAVAFLVMNSARAAPLWRGAWLRPGVVPVGAGAAAAAAAGASASPTAAAAGAAAGARWARPSAARVLSRRLATVSGGGGAGAGATGGSGAAEQAAATAAAAGAAAAAAAASTATSVRGPPHEEALRRPLIICGPSGVGKGTLLGLMLQEFGDHFGFSVSHTTRGPRPGEEGGVHYHFTTHEEMRAGIEAGRFLEHATVHGNLYGTSFEAVRAVQAAGKVCVLDIDVQGVKSVKAAATEGRLDGMEPLYVFVAPPSLESLEARLRGRKTETEEQLQRRLGNAAREVEYGLSGAYDAVVVNDRLEKAFVDLIAFLEARYYRPQAAAPLPSSDAAAQQEQEAPRARGPE